MSNYTQRLQLLMDADERLAAAAGGAARYYADSAGLENPVILNLQAAVVAACKHCFHCHSSASSCDVTVQRLEDRIVIELSFPGKESPDGKDKPQISGVDEVHCDFLEDSSRLRLVKYIPKAA